MQSQNNLTLPHILEASHYNPPLENRHSYKGELLDFNERTIPIIQPVKKALIKFIKTGKIHAYPEYGFLNQKIANYANCASEQIIITNGSEQAIDIVFRTFLKAKDTIILPIPTYSMYAQFANILNINIKNIPYQEKNLSLSIKKIVQSITNKIKMIIICNPNNPTGTLLLQNEIEQICLKAQKTNTIILLDEAYFEFSNTTAISFINKYQNLVILRTFSKAFGLAGLRIGYCISQRQNINNFLKIRGPYDVNILASIGASTALDHFSQINAYIKEVMTEAKPLLEEFFQKSNIPYYQSTANFILFKPKNPIETQKKLSQNGFLLRYQNRPPIQNTLRISIGTTKQIKSFIKIYKKIIIEKSI